MEKDPKVNLIMEGSMHKPISHRRLIRSSEGPLDCAQSAKAVNQVKSRQDFPEPFTLDGFRNPNFKPFFILVN